MELADHRQDVGGHERILHSQLHLVVPKHTPRVYATVTTHVSRGAHGICHGSRIRAAERGRPPTPLARFSRGPGADHTQPEPNPEFFAAACSHGGLRTGRRQARGTERTRDARNAPEGINKSTTVSGPPSTNGPVCLAALYHLCVSFYFFLSFEMICGCVVMFMRRRVFVYTGCGARCGGDLQICPRSLIIQSRLGHKRGS